MPTPQFAPRHIESEILRALHDDPIRVVIVTGKPGTGVRVLVRRLAIEVQDILSFECDEAIPADPPPEFIAGRKLLVGTHSVAALPPWILELPAREREIIEVETLSLSELLDLLEARLGGPVQAETAREIAAHTDSIPGLITVVLRTLVRTRLLLNIDGVWLLTAPIDPALFTDSLEGHLALLPPDTRSAFIDLCLREPVAVTRESRRQFDTVAAHGLATVDVEGMYRTRAHLIGVVGRLIADPVRRVDAFEELLAQDQPPHHVIRWALEKRVPVPLTQIEETVRRATGRHEWRNAHAIVDTLRETVPKESAAYVRILLLDAVALRFLDEPEEALTVLDEVDRILTRVHDPELSARSSVLRAEILAFQLGDIDAAVQSLADAHEQHRDPALIGHAVYNLVYAGQFAQAERLRSKDREDLMRIDHVLSTRLRVAHALTLVARGQPKRGFSVASRLGLREGLRFRKREWIVEEISTAYFVSAISAQGPAKLSQTMRHIELRRLDRFEPDNTTFRLARASWWMMRGDLPDAFREADLARIESEFHDPSGVRRAVLALYSKLAALSGNLHAAHRAFREALDTHVGSSGVIHGSVEAHLATTAILLGVETAEDELLATAKNFANDGLYGFAAEVLYVGVRFGKKRPAERLIDLTEHLDGLVHELRIAHARAIVSRDALALSQAADRMVASGLGLYAIEAAALARSTFFTPPDTVRRRTQHQLSELLLRSGPLRHPLLREAPVSPATDLTRREREMQELIAAGLTNEEIAQRLHLSRRTVEGHISRLYRKTGQSRRDPGRRVPSRDIA